MGIGLTEAQLEQGYGLRTNRFAILRCGFWGRLWFLLRGVMLVRISIFHNDWADIGVARVERTEVQELPYPGVGAPLSPNQRDLAIGRVVPPPKDLKPPGGKVADEQGEILEAIEKLQLIMKEMAVRQPKVDKE